MTIASIGLETAAHNPLDILEELVSANEWPFDRSSRDEMVVEATGRWCDYRMFLFGGKTFTHFISPVPSTCGFPRTGVGKLLIYWL